MAVLKQRQRLSEIRLVWNLHRGDLVSHDIAASSLGNLSNNLQGDDIINSKVKRGMLLLMLDVLL